jgi:hypothetical protein
MTPAQILDLPMQDNDAEAATIREYLGKLLTELWNHGENFDAKRPFGNSGWEMDIYKALVQNEAITGEVDEEGYIEDCDDREGDRVITLAIRALVAA